MPIKIQLGDMVELKKKHPCGGNVFEVMRAGMDFRLRCCNCNKHICLSRPLLEKRLRKNLQVETEENKT